MSLNKAINCLKCSALAVLLLLFQSVDGQSSNSVMDDFLKENQKTLGTDFVMLISKGDSLLYKKEMGSFNSKTAVSIGGSSRWLTTALVLQMAAEGIIDLDDKVSKWLPVFEKYGKSFLTVRLCLSHMTGIADDSRGVKKVFTKKKFSSLEEQVDAYAAKEIRSNPGSDFWYGDMGFDIAARVVEVAGKKKFDQLIRQRLLNAAGMRKTTFSNMEGGAVDPSNGAQSTADDMMKFLSMLHNGGMVMGKQVLDKKVVEMLTTPAVLSMPLKYVVKEAENFKYALGSWIINPETNGLKTYSSPEWTQSFPVIDLCRRYQLLFLAKEAKGDNKTQLTIKAKAMADALVPAGCN